MTLTNKEQENFQKVFDNILTPVVEECKEDISRILDNDPELKAEINKKVEEIMKMRKERKKNTEI